MHKFAVFLFVFALVLRLAFLKFMPEIPILPWGDDAYYQKTAEQLYGLFHSAPKVLSELAHHATWKGTGVMDKLGLSFPLGIFHRSPLYPLFLALVYLIVGGVHVHAAFVVQAVLSSLSCVLLFYLGQALFPRRVGMIAGVACALYLPFLISMARILQESLAAFLLLATVLFSVAAVKKRNTWVALFSGFLLALVILERPALQYLFLFYIPVFCWIVFHGVNRQKGIVLAASFLAAFLIPILIWMGVMAHEYGRWGMISDCPGGASSVFRCGIPTTDGWCTDGDRIGLGQKSIRELEKAGISAQRQAGSLWPPDKALLKGTMHVAIHQPLAFARITLHKMRRLWDRPELFPWDDVFDSAGLWSFLHLAIVVMAIFGMTFSLGRFYGLALVMTVLFYMTALHGISQSLQRYALPVFPFAILLAAQGFQQGVDWFRHFEKSKLAWIFIGFFVLSAVTIIFRQDSHATVWAMRIFWVMGGFVVYDAVKALATRRRALVNALVFLMCAVPLELWAQADAFRSTMPIVLRIPGQWVQQDFKIPENVVSNIQNARLWLDIREPRQRNPFKLSLSIQGEVVKQWDEALPTPKNPFFYFEYPELFEVQGRAAASIPQWIPVDLSSAWIKNQSKVVVKLMLVSNKVADSPSILVGAYRQGRLEKQVWEGPCITREPANTSALKYLYDGEPRLWGRERLSSATFESTFSDKNGNVQALSRDRAMGIRLELQSKNGEKFLL